MGGHRSSARFCALAPLAALTALGVVSSAFLGGCEKRAPVEPMCLVTAPTVCPEPAPRYADVETILAQRCVSCHYGMPEGPWPLTDYQSVVDWEDLIRTDLLNCTMPPTDGGISMPMEERLAVLTWMLCGHLE